MLGRNSYTTDELANGKANIAAQITAYKKLAKEATAHDAVSKALSTFDPQYFNNMVFVLDRLYVHRVRNVSGKDNNALNEVELITESLLNNGGVFQTNKVIKYTPEGSVLGLADGDRILLTAAQFEKLSNAFFAELESRFVSA